ncbi:MAG: hypothetical protein N3G20_00945 [Verrucomicrobiae bacterium]|nr:hypothetical protein [Verrucomicrobiae bacterium]
MSRVRVSILQRVVPLACHRVLVIDPGRRQLKLLLAEATFGRFRVIHRQAVDMPEEGTFEPEEIQQHLGLVLPELGPHQTAIVLPQHKIITQTVDVPPNHLHAPHEFLLAEAKKLSGLGEDELAFAFARLQPYGTVTHPYLVAFCKRKELDSLIACFAPENKEFVHEEDQLIEITSTAQGLVSASKMLKPSPENAVLVDLGARETTVVILISGQGVFATSFEGGSDSFTNALVDAKVAAPEQAESLQHSTDFFQEPTLFEPVVAAVNKWHNELLRCVKEWIEDNPALKLGPADLPVYLAGGGAAQKGLVDHLNRLSQLQFRRWPNLAGTDPMDSFWVASGVARVALGLHPGALSFLPKPYRERKCKRALWESVQAVVLGLLVLVSLILGFATRKNALLLDSKRVLMAKTTQALESARSISELSQQLETGYTAIRPILHHRNRTLTTLQSWLAVNQVRTNNDFWMVLFADGPSYLDGTTAPQLLTNQPITLHPLSAGYTATNAEYVAEVCIPAQGEPARRILSQFIASLKQVGVFTKVDALPTERKRELVDPRVFISNQVYGVAMEVPTQALPQPVAYDIKQSRPTESKRKAIPAPPPPENKPASTNTSAGTVTNS